MTNYDVEDWTTQGTLKEVATAIKAKYEDIVDSKVIRFIEVHHNAGKIWYAIMIYDA